MTRWVLLLAFALGLGACATPPPPGPERQEDRFGAPAVVAPRDVRPFAQDPCVGPLEEAAWESLEFSRRGGVESLSTGEKLCDRDGLGGERAVSFIVIPARDVLVDTYRARQFALFHPATIGGLPATIEQSSAQSLSCTVTVGTATDQGFIVNYSEYDSGASGQPGDPCVLGQRVAGRIVAALPSFANK